MKDFGISCRQLDNSLTYDRADPKGGQSAMAYLRYWLARLDIDEKTLLWELKGFRTRLRCSWKWTP